jgi:hypothetical protein
MVGSCQHGSLPFVLYIALWKKKRVTIRLDDCLPVKACHNQIMVDIPLSVLYCALISGSVFPSLCKLTSALI